MKKMDNQKFGVRELFGRAKPPFNRWIPAYLRIDWHVNDAEWEEYEPGDPPRSGDITLHYFATSFNEWTEIINKFNNNQLTEEEAKTSIKQVKFRTFPTMLDEWEVLMEKFVRDEITQAEVITGMLKASKDFYDSGGVWPKKEEEE